MDFERCCLKNNELFDNFKCIICYLITNVNLITTCCDQIICKICLKVLLIKKNECPHCRQINFKTAELNRKMNSILDTLKFKCRFKKQGCNEKLAINQIIKHENNCKFNPNFNIKCEKCINNENKILSNFNDILIKEKNVKTIRNLLFSLKYYYIII